MDDVFSPAAATPTLWPQSCFPPQQQQQGEQQEAVCPSCNKEEPQADGRSQEPGDRRAGRAQATAGREFDPWVGPNASDALHDSSLQNGKLALSCLDSRNSKRLGFGAGAGPWEAASLAAGSEPRPVGSCELAAEPAGPAAAEGEAQQPTQAPLQPPTEGQGGEQHQEAQNAKGSQPEQQERPAEEDTTGEPEKQLQQEDEKEAKEEEASHAPPQRGFLGLGLGLGLALPSLPALSSLPSFSLTGSSSSAAKGAAEANGTAGSAADAGGSSAPKPASKPIKKAAAAAAAAVGMQLPLPLVMHQAEVDDTDLAGVLGPLGRLAHMRNRRGYRLAAYFWPATAPVDGGGGGGDEVDRSCAPLRPPVTADAREGMEGGSNAPVVTPRGSGGGGSVRSAFAPAAAAAATESDAFPGRPGSFAESVDGSIFTGGSEDEAMAAAGAAAAVLRRVDSRALLQSLPHRTRSLAAVCLLTHAFSVASHVSMEELAAGSAKGMQAPGHSRSSSYGSSIGREGGGDGSSRMSSSSAYSDAISEAEGEGQGERAWEGGQDKEGEEDYEEALALAFAVAEREESVGESTTQQQQQEQQGQQVQQGQQGQEQAHGQEQERQKTAAPQVSAHLGGAASDAATAFMTPATSLVYVQEGPAGPGPGAGGPGEGASAATAAGAVAAAAAAAQAAAVGEGATDEPSEEAAGTAEVVGAEGKPAKLVGGDGGGELELGGPGAAAGGQAAPLPDAAMPGAAAAVAPENRTKAKPAAGGGGGPAVRLVERPKGVVVLVHGHGAYLCWDFLRTECPGSRPVYEGSWVQHLNSQGYAVCGIDLQGAGRSEGRRCFIEKFDHYVQDVIDFATALGHARQQQQEQQQEQSQGKEQEQTQTPEEEHGVAGSSASTAKGEVMPVAAAGKEADACRSAEQAAEGLRAQLQQEGHTWAGAGLAAGTAGGEGEVVVQRADAGGTAAGAGGEVSRGATPGAVVVGGGGGGGGGDGDGAVRASPAANGELASEQQAAPADAPGTAAAAADVAVGSASPLSPPPTQQQEHEGQPKQHQQDEAPPAPSPASDQPRSPSSSPSPPPPLPPPPTPALVPGFPSSPCLAPRFIMGLSLGGGIATHVMRRTGTELFRGAVLLAPMISLEGMASRGANPLLRLAAAVLNVLYPQLPIVRGEPNKVFPIIQQLWDADPDCFQEGTRVRNALEYLRACQQLCAELGQLDFPFLVFHSGRDRWTDPGGSAALYSLSPSPDKTHVAVDHMYHVLTKEEGWQAVLERAVDWLDDRV